MGVSACVSVFAKEVRVLLCASEESYACVCVCVYDGVCAGVCKGGLRACVCMCEGDVCFCVQRRCICVFLCAREVTTFRAN